MKNVEFRMFGATMRLVVLVLLISTALIVMGKLTGSEWVTLTMGLVGGWVLRDGATKAAEAYRDTKVPPQ